ncbi:MAG: aminotransferase class V-fold PLP-dependent enzyme [Bdellovibrionota bacterium]
MSEFRQYFRYPENILFFNSGSMSLSPASVIDAVATEKNKYESNPTEGIFGAWEKMWATQKQLANFLNCRPQDLYLRPNVSYALNDFLMALQLPEKSEILVSDLEYGSIVKICEYKAQIENLSVREFSFYQGHEAGASSGLTEEKILNAIENALSRETKMVMLSHIMTGTGLKIPINKIGLMLRKKGIFFVVDGAHGLGSSDLNLDANSLDYYGSNLHKWTMGPKGTGFGWVAEHMRKHLVPRFAGWTTGTIAPYYDSFGDGDKWAQRWMINSSVNFADFHGIPSAFEFWRTHGPDKIKKTQRDLLSKTKKAVQEATGWTCVSEYSEDLHGPLVAFRLPIKMMKPNLMKELYTQHKLVVSTPFIRGETLLRLSPNIYNTENEIQKVADILRSISA